MKEQIKDAPPPFFKKWNRMYMMILSIHAVILFLFWLFTKAYQS